MTLQDLINNGLLDIQQNGVWLQFAINDDTATSWTFDDGLLGIHVGEGYSTHFNPTESVTLEGINNIRLKDTEGFTARLEVSKLVPLNLERLAQTERFKLGQPVWIVGMPQGTLLSPVYIPILGTVISVTISPGRKATVVVVELNVGSFVRHETKLENEVFATEEEAWVACKAMGDKWPTP